MDRVVITTDEGVAQQIEAPSNSNKRKISQIATAKIKKEPVAKKIFSEFIAKDMNDFAHTAVFDILIPYAKNALVDFLHDSIDSLFGTQPKNRRRNGVYVDYSSYSRQNERVERRERVKGYNFNELTFRTRIEAENVIEHMVDIIETDGSVTVADLYSLVGIKSAYTDETYGWTNLKSAIPQRTNDGYILLLPKPVLI